MKQIDKYIARHVLGGFMLVLLVIVGLDLLFALVEELKDISGAYDLMAAGKYVLLTMPRRLYEFVPLSCLIGCLLGLGVLASNTELTVMRAAGLSIFRINLSVMKPITLIVLLTIGLGEIVVPHTEQVAQSYRQVTLTGNKMIHKASQIWHRDGMTFLHINAVIPDGSIKGITRYEFREDRSLKRASFAQEGIYKENQWELRNIRATNFPLPESAEANLRVKLLDKENWVSSLTPDLLKVVVVKPDNLSISGLHDYSNYLSEQGLKSERFKIAFWNKVLLPVAIFALVLVAISFVFGSLRNVSLGQRLVTGIVVGLVFKMLQDILGSTSAVLGFSPFIAVALPIVFCGCFGFWLLARTR